MTWYLPFKISIAKTDVFAIECLDQHSTNALTFSSYDHLWLSVDDFSTHLKDSFQVHSIELMIMLIKDRNHKNKVTYLVTW